MPKVLRIINRFNLGGPIYNAAYLSKYLTPEFDTMLIGGMKDESEASSIFIAHDLGLQPVVIEEMRREVNPTNDRAAYKKIKQIITKFQPDIVHTHAAKAGALGRLAAYALKVPIVVHTFHGHVFHSYFGNLKTNMFKTIERSLARKSTRIIAISNKQKEELSNVHRICEPDKIEVIPLGFDLSRFSEGQVSKRSEFRREWGLKDGEIAIGIVGRLVPVKNHQLYLKAIRHVLDNTKRRIRAFILGDGESRNEIETLAHKLALYAPELTLTSWVRNIDVAYAGLDLVVLSSLNEGTPVSLIEAQAANKPVLSTRVGGITNVVLEGATALLSDVSDEKGFCNNLLDMVNNWEETQKMGTQGREHVHERFHYQRLVRDMGALYRQLLTETSK